MCYCMYCGYMSKKYQLNLEERNWSSSLIVIRASGCEWFDLWRNRLDLWSGILAHYCDGKDFWLNSLITIISSDFGLESVQVVTNWSCNWVNPFRWELNFTWVKLQPEQGIMMVEVVEVAFFFLSIENTGWRCQSGCGENQTNIQYGVVWFCPKYERSSRFFSTRKGLENV